MEYQSHHLLCEYFTEEMSVLEREMYNILSQEGPVSNNLHVKCRIAILTQLLTKMNNYSNDDDILYFSVNEWSKITTNLLANPGMHIR